jgi:hypothetical protein
MFCSNILFNQQTRGFYGVCTDFFISLRGYISGNYLFNCFGLELLRRKIINQKPNEGDFMRITDRDLEAVVKRINLITNSPIESYVKNENGKFQAQIGNYHLSYAYGGVSLHRMDNEAGGVTTPLNCGHITKRELYNLMQAFINGLQTRE